MTNTLSPHIWLQINLLSPYFTLLSPSLTPISNYEIFQHICKEKKPFTILFIRIKHIRMKNHMQCKMLLFLRFVNKVNYFVILIVYYFGENGINHLSGVFQCLKIVPCEHPRGDSFQITLMTRLFLIHNKSRSCEKLRNFACFATAAKLAKSIFDKNYISQRKCKISKVSQQRRSSSSQHLMLLHDKYFITPHLTAN